MFSVIRRRFILNILYDNEKALSSHSTIFMTNTFEIIVVKY